MLDLYGCDVGKLDSEKFLTSFLLDLPERIGMRRISDPHILRYEGNSESFDSGGISAFVLIAESHISVHTFVEQRYASVDIFSCKQFDTEFTKNYIFSAFSAKRAEIRLLNRGREFPKDVRKSKGIAIKQRAKLGDSEAFRTLKETKA
jgi:S-adenosylmethionine decarboxylase